MKIITPFYTSNKNGTTIMGDVITEYKLDANNLNITGSINGLKREFEIPTTLISEAYGKDFSKVSDFKVTLSQETIDNGSTRENIFILSPNAKGKLCTMICHKDKNDSYKFETFKLENIKLATSNIRYNDVSLSKGGNLGLIGLGKAEGSSALLNFKRDFESGEIIVNNGKIDKSVDNVQFVKSKIYDLVFSKKTGKGITFYKGNSDQLEHTGNFDLKPLVSCTGIETNLSSFAITGDAEIDGVVLVYLNKANDTLHSTTWRNGVDNQCNPSESIHFDQDIDSLNLIPNGKGNFTVVGIEEAGHVSFAHINGTGEFQDDAKICTFDPKNPDVLFELITYYSSESTRVKRSIEGAANSCIIPPHTIGPRISTQSTPSNTGTTAKVSTPIYSSVVPTHGGNATTTTSNPANSTGLGAGAIAGISVGAVSVGVIILGLVVCVCKKTCKGYEQDPERNPLLDNADDRSLNSVGGLNFGASSSPENEEEENEDVLFSREGSSDSLLTNINNVHRGRDSSSRCSVM